MIIIRSDVKPHSNIYYLGAVFLDVIKKQKNSTINLEYLISLVNNSFPSLSINQILYTLDWLYLLDAIKLSDEGDIEIAVK
ncbi:ABC-three component system middle component 6 [Bacillus sp. 7504-2]|jgi:hypothetical protein|uniref:ABC-three component system middle component 6 n=1 Tax=Aeribacillus sp. FSL k6-2211 TaxID=2954608 RepID=UPI000BA7A4FF|nr:hypothetical protein CHH80_09595 [Bacillus sp. 7504-2]